MVYSAMSIANAMRVRRAAMKEMSDENRTSVICDERENRRAIKVAPVAAVRKRISWSGMNGLDRDGE
jgi:hypothetical protein